MGALTPTISAKIFAEPIRKKGLSSFAAKAPRMAAIA
jgi:hypothetical protein